jgi:hypothetical protein
MTGGNRGGSSGPDIGGTPRYSDGGVTSAGVMTVELPLPETPYRGRSQALLYNTIRPHASLGYKPPAPEVFVSCCSVCLAGGSDGAKKSLTKKIASII